MNLETGILLGSLVTIYFSEQIQAAGRRFRERFQEPEPEPVDRLVERYTAGEISLVEYERHVELLLDPDAQQLRTELEAINGIGPDTSAAIAEQFATLDELETADESELAAIHGVGPTTAAAVVERFD